MFFIGEDKAAINFLRVNKHYCAKRLWKEYLTKNWSLKGLNKLSKKTDVTVSVEQLKGAGWLRSVRCNDSIELIEQLTLSQEEKHIIA